MTWTRPLANGSASWLVTSCVEANGWLGYDDVVDSSVERDQRELLGEQGEVDGRAKTSTSVVGVTGDADDVDEKERVGEGGGAVTSDAGREKIARETLGGEGQVVRRTRAEALCLSFSNRRRGRLGVESLHPDVILSLVCPFSPGAFM